MFNSRFLYGALTGVAVASTGFYIYQRNKDKVDAFLRSHGIHVPAAAVKDYADMDLKELTVAKEGLEDMIAEMEHAQKQTEQAGTKKKNPINK